MLDAVRVTVQTWPWVPQNDLLGHRNTRAFLTHCGSNGMYEVSPACAGHNQHAATALTHKGCRRW